MQIRILENQKGYSLFELILVMIVISILMTASLKYMGSSVDNTRVEETKEELNQIADAIIGNDSQISGSKRSDYGYVGDIGALPVNLNNLVTNPGLATWNGPYIHDDYYASSASAESEYSIDAWGKTYSYSNGTTISSSGGTTTITKELANSTDEILYNSVSFNILDLGFCPPGMTYSDSILFNLTYPNGLGSHQTDSKTPSSSGYVQFDSLPIGQHTLQVIELTNNDTLTKKINVNLNTNIHSDIQIPNSLWCDTTGSGSGGGGTSGVEILRPNANGTVTQLQDEGCSNHYSCVNETSSDGDDSYVKSENGSYKYDTYNIPNSTIGSGTIDSVIIFIIAKKTVSNNSQKVSTYILTNGQYYSDQVPATTNYATFSTTYIQNPQSSSAWTWSEIDALQIGVGIQKEARVTQVWVEIYYTN